MYLFLLLAHIQSLLLSYFYDTATTAVSTLSLHDALPILWNAGGCLCLRELGAVFSSGTLRTVASFLRSEEHTSELQSPCNLVCRLLLEKKKKYLIINDTYLAHHSDLQTAHL